MLFKGFQFSVSEGFKDTETDNDDRADNRTLLGAGR
jgi:hypothetical protein